MEIGAEIALTVVGVAEVMEGVAVVGPVAEWG